MHDWVDLPTEILGIVFEYCLCDSGSAVGYVEVDELRREIQRLQSVCRTWAKVMLDISPKLAVGISFQKLANEPGVVCCQRATDWADGFIFSNKMDALALYPAFTSGNDSCETSRDTNWNDTEHTLLLSKSLGGIAHRCQNLRCLTILLPDAARDVSLFDSEWIRELRRLERLELRRFKDYQLDCLPVSLRSVILEYGQVWVRDILSSHSISVLSLPVQCKLEHLEVRKAGTLGLITRQLVEQCKTVHVDALYLLLGVTVSDQGMIQLYQRPYREGAYVPPHILGDWDAIETSHRAADSACTSLLEYLARSPELQSIQFRGMCSESVKIVPALPQQELDMLLWISRITEQASSLLFGMSGIELMDRVIQLVQMRLLQQDRINIDLQQDSFSITISTTT